VKRLTGMSGKSALLDTNIVIGLFADDPQIVSAIGLAKEIYIPSIVLGELYYGAHQSTRKTTNLSRIEEFSRSCQVLSCDEGTASYYGQIKSLLKSAGKPIPENDIWIGALAMQHKIRLVTRDEHFSHIPALIIERW